MHLGRRFSCIRRFRCCWTCLIRLACDGCCCNRDIATRCCHITSSELKPERAFKRQASTFSSPDEEAQSLQALMQSGVKPGPGFAADLPHDLCQRVWVFPLSSSCSGSAFNTVRTLASCSNVCELEAVCLSLQVVSFLAGQPPYVHHLRGLNRLRKERWSRGQTEGRSDSTTPSCSTDQRSKALAEASSIKLQLLLIVSTYASQSLRAHL